MSKTSIKLENITKHYEDSGSAFALKGVSLEVPEGEFVSIIGPSGCGKSTLIKMVVGLEHPSSGNLTMPGNASMVFQSGAVFPWLTVKQNVRLALISKANDRPSDPDPLVEHYLGMVGLLPYKHEYPRQLSGGQRQRIGIARALAVDPSVLVMDEPFSALDIKTTEELHQDLITIWEATHKTIILVSHSIEEAVVLADRVVLMNDGQIDEIFDLRALKRPRREQAERFITEVQKIRTRFLKVA